MKRRGSLFQRVVSSVEWGNKDYVFNMGSFAEFCRVPSGMGEINPLTGVLEPVV
jgi:hypothetical protein